ncbi:u-box domain-containing protein 33-like [Hordeum vulgare]|nr:u-box domain-containing protein 33-like [Hordeum vulgare]
MEPVWETASARSDTAAATEEEEAGGVEETVKVFVAVPEQHKNGQLTLAWALRNLPDVAPTAADVEVVVAHVHVPAKMIHGKQVPRKQVEFRAGPLVQESRKSKADKHLDEYIRPVPPK